MLTNKQEETLSKVKSLLGPIIEDEQLELFGIRILHHKASCAIEIFIDRPYGGITMGECARVNKKLIAKIDSENFLGGNYTLEVSSPGCEWPLKTKKDFLRISGHRTRMMLLEPYLRIWVIMKMLWLFGNFHLRESLHRQSRGLKISKKC